MKQNELKAQDVAGDLNTFEMVFRDYYTPLVQYGNTLLKDFDETEDVVQQVFISVWEKGSLAGVHTSARSLLYKAVYNACLNRLKHRKIRSEHAEELKATQPVPETTHLLQAQELELRIHQAIELLPEQCGKIFKMSRFEQLKYQEIADKMGLSVKTVENQMGKALKVIRGELSDYLPLFILSLIGQL